ncbi:RecF/RecN/SMC [Globomyces pollinis-pini]|nr:RecF/RecN/SMC [Globomyces pollinis-pini]
MYIKQIIIQGFKSYKDQTVMEPFSQNHNVVVGRNGSGKSNFFWAIRFVLNDAYANMTREERQSLLHEGSGQPTISAYVEIIFDNSDNRFPTGKEEVVLRRTIGLKKDEYSLDRKSVTKSEVLNLLESAGFSRSNPYYIVPQGRITALTNSKDSERLQLLKEVAGTKVYEQRRVESVKIMDETDLKRNQINELLDYIEERLSELDQEKEDLAKFQTADRERRCLEYSIYFKEQNESLAQLEMLEESRAEELNETVKRYENLSDRMMIIQQLEHELLEHRESHGVLLLEKTQLQEDFQECIQTKSTLELSITDLEKAVKDCTKSTSEVNKERNEIVSLIKSKQDALDKLVPEFDNLKMKELEINERMALLNAQLDSLKAKQGSFDRFKTQKDRDLWLKEMLKNCEDDLTGTLSQQNDLGNEKKKTEEDLSALEAELTALKTRLVSRRSQLEELDASFRETQLKKDTMEQERKLVWRNEAKLTATAETLRQSAEKSFRTLMTTMDRNTSRGLKSINRIVERLKIKGYYGPLYELFTVEENLHTAVEVVAGASLFHVVVDTDETASMILKSLNQEKGGRVTFMPLNRLRPHQTKYPDSTDAIPLISRLEYDPKFHPAILQVFGKAIVAPTLEEASNFARTHQLTGVTFEGDRADRKGALTGGFHDHRHSRLEAIKSMLESRSKLDENAKKLDSYKKDIVKLDQEILKLRDKCGDLTAQKKQMLSGREPLALEIETKIRYQEQLQSFYSQQNKSWQQLESRLEKIRSQITSIHSDLKEPLRKKLSQPELDLLESLPNDIESTRVELADLTARRAEVELNKNDLEITLSTNLKRRLELIDNKMDGLEDNSHLADQLIDQRHELEKVEQNIQKIESQIEVLNDQINNVQESITETNRKLESSHAAQAEDNLAMEKQQLMMEKFLTKRATLLQKKETAVRHIRDLGVLPEEAFEKYQELNSKQLLKRLHKVNETLGQYQHVNKKAFEQYVNFTNQREQLESRKFELDKSAKAIEKLIKTLDLRKNEVIEKTFDEVAKNFKLVWKSLVPDGDGTLVMLKRSEEDMSFQSQDDTFEQYTGVSLNVSFTPGQQLRMPQLSGGQKSLVALTLIFAIQKCDPAPFYLFDEIDAALDTQYRTAVADMVKELSKKAQFITTTFRPELLVHANKFYGVTFMNKVSKIQSITRENAQSFVEGQVTGA